MVSVTLVGLSGLEPPTSRLSGVRSNQLSYKPLAFYSVTGNGDGEIRTLDPLLARQVLSQLSYTPIGFSDLFSLSMSYPSLKIEQQPSYPTPIAEPRVCPTQFSLERR